MYKDIFEKNKCAQQLIGLVDPIRETKRPCPTQYDLLLD